MEIGCQWLQSETRLGTAAVDYYALGHLKTLLCSAPTKNDKTLTNTSFIPVRPSVCAPGPMKW
jgi:hypothetical protein